MQKNYFNVCIWNTYMIMDFEIKIKKENIVFDDDFNGRGSCIQIGKIMFFFDSSFRSLLGLYKSNVIINDNKLPPVRIYYLENNSFPDITDYLKIDNRIMGRIKKLFNYIHIGVFI